MSNLPRTGGVRGGLAGPLLAIGAALRLGWATRLRVRGTYWTWRWQTAFGRGAPRGVALARSLYEYLVWSARMRGMK